MTFDHFFSDLDFETELIISSQLYYIERTTPSLSIGVKN